MHACRHANLRTCLCIYQSTCLSVYISVHLAIYLPIRPSIITYPCEVYGRKNLRAPSALKRAPECPKCAPKSTAHQANHRTPKCPSEGSRGHAHSAPKAALLPRPPNVQPFRVVQLCSDEFRSIPISSDQLRSASSDQVSLDRHDSARLSHFPARRLKLPLPFTVRQTAA